MRVKIKDIAQICGVSTGTVDRALNNRPGISEKTKRKILAKAKELNYRPDYTARSLAVGRTMTIGVVLFDLYNRSYAQFMNAVELKAREAGYFVYITLTNKNSEDERACINYLVDRKVDGIILFTVNKGPEFEDFLKKTRVPVVTIFNYLSEEWEYIGIHERRAMKEAVQFLISENYKRIYYISPPLAYSGKNNIYTQEERLEGLLEAWKENEMEHPPHIIKDKNYLDILKENAIVSRLKTAIVCSCDLYALEVMNYLKFNSIRIPEEVGVMGFDDIDMIKYVSPKLTTVKYPIEKIGSKAVETLIHKIEQNIFLSPPLLDYEIIHGQST